MLKWPREWNWSCPRHAHPRIKRGVRDVREEPGQEYKDSNKKRHRRHGVDVVLGHGVDEELTHAMPAKDLLGEGRSHEEEREFVGKERHHRNERRPEAVFDER